MATAGLLTVQTDTGGKATVDVLYTNGSSAAYTIVDGSIADKSKKAGEVTAKILNQDEVKAAAVRSQVTDPNGAWKKTVARMGYQGALATNLQSLEPLDVDLFLPADENVVLLSDYDIPLFLLNGIAFSEGQEFTSINGLIANVSGLVFRDVSSLFTSSDDSFFDLSIDVDSPLWDSLPLYSGQVTVTSQLEFRQIPVPEPNMWPPIIGILVFLIWRHSGSWFPYKNRIFNATF